MEKKYKVVYNAFYGGFSLSLEAFSLYNKKRVDQKLKPILETDISSIRRDDPHLVQVVEELGLHANGRYAKLKIQEIPVLDKKCWFIREYDGKESVIFDPLPHVRELLVSDIDSLTLTETKDLLKEIKHFLTKGGFSSHKESFIKA